MIKKLGLATALSALLLSGCGGGSGDSTPSNTTATLQDKLLGTWELTENNITGCYNDTGDATSYDLYLTVTQDKILFENKEYSEYDCNENDLSYHSIHTYSYILGNETKDASNTDAYEMEMTQTGFTLKEGSSDGSEFEDMGKTDYSMFKIDGDKLSLPNTDNSVNDGSTKEKRANQFNSDLYWTQK